MEAGARQAEDREGAQEKANSTLTPTDDDLAVQKELLEEVRQLRSLVESLPDRIVTSIGSAIDRELREYRWLFRILILAMIFDIVKSFLK
jgi:hypothetical protein